MGFEDRDYYREESEGGFFAAAGSAVKVLIAVNIAVFLLQILSTRGGGAASDAWLEFHPALLLDGHVWRLVTWGFGYGGDPLAFIFEMLFIWWFGKSLESMYGTREFSLFYAASLLIAPLVYTLAAVAEARGVRVPFDPAASLIGASIPVMAITVLFSWHYPKHKILLFFLIPIDIWIIVAIYVVYNLYGYAQGQSVGLFLAALSPVAFGLLYGWQNWRIENAVPAGPPKLRLPKRKPKLRVFEPQQPVDLDRQVDEILAKIHEHGEASLTDRERKTLQEASRRYRKT